MINKSETKPMNIQTLIFDKKKFSSEEAKSWASAHDFKSSKIDENANSVRLRQRDPGEFTTMRTISLTDGVKAVVGKSKEVVDKQGSGVMVCLYMPDDVAQYLSEKGTEPKESMHCTIAYVPGVGDRDDIFEKMVSSVKFVADAFPPIAGKINGVGMFNATVQSDGKNVYWAAFDAVALDKVRSMVVEQLQANGIDVSDKHGFTPHVTLSYMPSDEFIPQDQIATSMFTVPHLTVARKNKREDIPFKGHKILKSQPAGAQVHVNKPIGEETEKSGYDLTDLTPEVNNTEIDVIKAGFSPHDIKGGMEELQHKIAGVDWELANTTNDLEEAKDLAHRKTQEQPYHYYKEGLMEQPSGLKLDLGCGHQREPGHIGVDLYPHDHATVVHDMSLGLPFPDNSASHVRLSNVLDDYEGDPKPLMAEISRTMKPGGSLVYEGKGDMPAVPPGFVQLMKEGGGSAPTRQEFAKLHVDPATANDTEVRVDVPPFDNLPADQLMAMQALDYYWSDATTSHDGNVFYGYPSQGIMKSYPMKGLKRFMSKLFKKPIKGPTDNTGATPDGMMAMSKSDLTTEGRKDIPTSNFALPEERKYPIHDISHARNALARVAQHGTEEEQAKVRAAVYRKYPSLKDRAEKGAEKMLKSDRVVPIMKADLTKQIVYGVVLSPDELDSQDDWMQAQDIEDAAHYYLMKSRVIGSGHTKPVQAMPVESYIAPQDLNFDGPNGPQIVKKGAWVLGAKVTDPEEWQKVLDGEYTGWSVGGFGLRDRNVGPA